LSVDRTEKNNLAGKNLQIMTELKEMLEKIKRENYTN
jgi:hypothetical protein